MLHNSLTGETPEEPLLCQFCEDYSPQRATLSCNECTFMYCGTCFDACHPSKGPLADHSIGPPVARPVKRKETSLQCQQHTDEKLALYCVDCKMPVCYLCKEYGKHKGHKVELLEPVFRNSKVKSSYIIREFSGSWPALQMWSTPASKPKTIRHLTDWHKGRQSYDSWLSLAPFNRATKRWGKERPKIETLRALVNLLVTCYNIIFIFTCDAMLQTLTTVFIVKTRKN